MGQYKVATNPALLFFFFWIFLAAKPIGSPAGMRWQHWLLGLIGQPRFFFWKAGRTSKKVEFLFLINVHLGEPGAQWEILTIFGS